MIKFGSLFDKSWIIVMLLLSEVKVSEREREREGTREGERTERGKDNVTHRQPRYMLVTPEFRIWFRSPLYSPHEEEVSQICSVPTQV